MVNHPNRSRSKDAPGRNPSAHEVAELRHHMGLTAVEFAALVYRSERIVEEWEAGLRRCPADTWEYLNLLHEFPEVRRCREAWLNRR